MSSVYGSGLYETAIYDDVDVGAPKVELYLNGAWVDITAYVRIADGIRIQRGRQDWSSQPTFATCEMTLDNRDGRFSPRNASGAYYPYLVRNTPLRVSVYLDSGSTTVRFWGDVAAWPVAWDPSGRNAWVNLEAAGLRRRLTQGAIPLQSPYRIAAGALTTLAAYWPMEETTGATGFGSVTPSGYAMTVTGTVEAGGSEDFSTASLPVAVITGDQSAVAGNVRPWTLPAGGQQVRMLIECDTTTAGQGVDVVVGLSNGDYIVAEYVPVANTLQVQYRSPDGTVVANVGPTSVASSQPWTNPSRISIESVQNGTGVDFGVVWLSAGQTSGFSLGGTAALTTLTRVASVRVQNGGADVTTALGHVTVESGKTSIFDLLTVLTGYAGETALARVTRLTTAAGVALTSTAGNVLSALVGPQGEATLLDLVDEAMAVDGGISTEDVPTRSLLVRTRSSLYDQAEGQRLSYSAHELRDLQPVDDDQATVNDVTVSRTNGGSANYMVTSGNLAVSAIGDYAASYDLNLYADDQVLPQAQWRATLGTIDSPRWPVVQTDANRLALASRRTSIVALREGSWIGLSNLPSYSGGDATLQKVTVLGWTEEITDVEWIFTFNTAPADVLQAVFILDDATYGILDTDRLAL